MNKSKRQFETKLSKHDINDIRALIMMAITNGDMDYGFEDRIYDLDERMNRLALSAKN